MRPQHWQYRRLGKLQSEVFDMRNEWVGDIGDFSKFVLLNALCEDPKKPLRLAVVWYLNITGILPADYFNLQNFAPGLWDAFNDLAQNDNRTVTSALYTGQLPQGTLFFAEPIPKPLNQDTRENWHEGALDAVGDAKLVFVDPDTGIPNVGQEAGREHVTMCELAAFYGARGGKSLVIYQHPGREGNENDRIEDRVGRLGTLNPPPHHIYALRWNRRQARVYFVVVHPNHAGCLEQAVEAFVANPNWFERQRGFATAHFTNVPLN